MAKLKAANWIAARSRRIEAVMYYRNHLRSAVDGSLPSHLAVRLERVDSPVSQIRIQMQRWCCPRRTPARPRKLACCFEPRKALRSGQQHWSNTVEIREQAGPCASP